MLVKEGGEKRRKPSSRHIFVFVFVVGVGLGLGLGLMVVVPSEELVEEGEESPKKI